jgi:hypothetical protein
VGNVVSGRPERRRSLRDCTADRHGIIRVRVRPGHDASLLEVSRDAAAIDTACRLLPGAAVELQFDNAAGRTCARGRILRCAVVGVHPHHLTYRAIVIFDDRQTWLPG